MAYGAQGEVANSFWIDGVNVNNPRNGGMTMGYNQSWIEEVHVTGIGAPAEYGGFTGVVANYTTRSGGNDFHGLFETFFQNEKLSSTNVPDPGEETPFTTYDFSTQLGGPILRDKLWFFTGIQYPHTETPVPGTSVLKVDTFRKVIAKGTYQWNSNNTVQAFATWNEHSFEQTGTFRPEWRPETTYLKSENPQWSWNATWVSLFGPQTTFEGRFGGNNDHYRDIEDNPDVGYRFDGGTKISSQNNPGSADNLRSRLQMNAALSHHADNFLLGSHDFRFGVQIENSNFHTDYQYNGAYRYYDYFGDSSSRTSGFNYMLEGSPRQFSEFAQDDWQITDRFRMSLGVRFDHSRAYGYADDKLLFKTDTVSPRVGFVWLLEPESQTVIKFHFGRYYEAVQARMYGWNTGYFEPLVEERYENGEWVETFRLDFGEGQPTAG